jgi:sugar O-acyltransferase (sialic acid O-acetyltransferase NeuD family)
LCGDDIRVEGFVDNDPRLQGEEVEGLRVLGAVSWLETVDPSEFSVVCAIGFPDAHRRIADDISAMGFKLMGVISKLAYLSVSSKVGDGVAVFPFAAIGPSVSVGDHSVVYNNASIAHESTVGRYSMVCPGAQIAGRVSIGEGCWIGIGASILQGVSIGSGSVIGAGAAVIRDVPENTVAAGVPARAINQRQAS